MTAITKTSMLTGREHTRDIPTTPERLHAWDRTPRYRRPHVQDAFPDLTADDREFLVSGISPEEWADAFGGEDFGNEDAD